MELPNGAVLRRLAACVGVVASVAGCGGRVDTATPSTTQQGTGQALVVKGLYTFNIQVAPACGWPLTAFAWPVLVEVASYVDGTTVGWVLFPPTSDRPSARWSIYASPIRTELVPAEGSPGPVVAAYDVVLEGGRWEAGGPTPGFDGRGQVTGGIATGARQTLKRPGSDRLWECRSDATWSLLVRSLDPD
jgi:hypothetical protein